MTSDEDNDSMSGLKNVDEGLDTSNPDNDSPPCLQPDSLDVPPCSVAGGANRGLISSTGGATSVRTHQKPIVDIMFIDDTSNSMRPYIENKFVKRFKSFISIIDKSLNWRWFYTNADYKEQDSWGNTATLSQALSLENDKGAMDTFVLSPEIPDYQDVFIRSITSSSMDASISDGEYSEEDDFMDHCSLPPYCQDEEEQPLSSLKSALAVNKHLTRREAYLVAVIITDVDETRLSSGADFITRPQEVIDQVKREYDANKKFIAFSIIIKPGDQECLKAHQGGWFNWFWSDAPFEGKNIAELVDKTNGENFSLCADDYSAVAESIVSHVSSH